MKTTSTLFRRPLVAGLGLLLVSNLPVAQAQQRTPPAQPPAGSLQAATPSGPWTLQAAVDYALDHNLNVRQSRLSAQLADVTLLQSRAALWPTANLNGSQTWNYGTSINPLTNDFQSQTTRSNNFSANTQVTLFSGFQLRNTIKRNVLEYEASLGDIEKARNDLALNVASAFLQTLLAQELVRTNQARVNSTQQQVDRTQVLLKAGSVAESNLIDSRAQLATDQLNVITAQNQETLARLQLAQFMNLNEAATQTLQITTPPLPDPDELSLADVNASATYQIAQANQPDIKAADLRVQSAIRNVEVARGAYYPRLFFGAGVFTGYSSARNLTVIGSDSSARRTTFYVNDPNGGAIIPLSVTTYQRDVSVLPQRYWDQLDSNLGRSLQFNLQVPILNGLQARTNVQRSRIAVSQAELRAEQTRLVLRQTIEQAYADALAAQRQYTASKEQVESLTLAYRNSEIRFNNGLLNGTEFNIAKNNLTAAESSMIQAKYSFIFRRKVLDFYQGKPIEL
ncbi:TolC family protein [Hymenobacter aerilatus]|uniref:TolC family protein n=1 Tax=Hymenobacter aerilatus TaxID=2932251 RepID=A0A8T9SYW5_9BACT|nr:TolC family protein [Hymenobacter aerilatus]UOR06867.1 TolC family protein [Hymenobacter aerilatus]